MSQYEHLRCACGNCFCVETNGVRRMYFLDNPKRDRQDNIPIAECPKKRLMSQFLETGKVIYLIRANEL